MDRLNTPSEAIEDETYHRGLEAGYRIGYIEGYIDAKNNNHQKVYALNKEKKDE